MDKKIIEEILEENNQALEVALKQMDNMMVQLIKELIEYGTEEQKDMIKRTIVKQLQLLENARNDEKIS